MTKKMKSGNLILYISFHYIFVNSDAENKNKKKKEFLNDKTLTCDELTISFLSKDRPD